jgi:AcrR family transcriptional regulator
MSGVRQDGSSRDDRLVAGPPLPRGPAPPVVDPAEELSPTAQRLLAAARRVLARDGFSGLTLEAITAEAGENKAAIRYHFGGKEALITTLVEWLDHDDSVKLLGLLSEEEGEDARLDLLLRLQQEGCKSQKENQLFFDLLPHILRDRALRSRLGELYQWYRDLDAWVLAPDAAEEDGAQVELLSALAIAVGDGLTVQRAADPAFDVDAVYEVWERLLRAALSELRESRNGDE